METYLGDGLYAKFDGYRLVLMANSHVEPTDVVYLDPSVWEALKKFMERARKELSGEN